jgi:hypothetical protein
MGPAMSDHEEPIRLADAAVRRLHDLFDVMRAIAAARGAQEDPVRITVALQASFKNWAWPCAKKSWQSSMCR